MSPQRRSVIVLFAIAWGLRIAAVFAVQYYLQSMAHPPRVYVIEGDADGYWQLAHKIVSWEPYQIYTPPRQVHRMPGFPALLALSIAIFGDSLLAARLLLATVGACGCLAIYQLGQRLYDHRIGMIAGGIAAISPIFVGFSAIELTETAFATSLVLGLIPLANRWDEFAPKQTSSAIWTGMLTGLGAGLGCYMRPSWLLFPPCLVLFLWGLRRSWPQFWCGITAIVVLGLTLLPWGIRNSHVTGHFTLTTFWMGPSLYDGWNPKNTTGDSDMVFFDQENLLGQMSEYEMDREYRRRAWEFAFENPGQVANLAWKKTLRYWNPFPNAAQFQAIPGLRWVSGAWYVLVFAPALVGVWTCRRDRMSLAICAGPIVYFAALHLIFVSSVRYRLPGEYALLILTAVGMDRLWGRGQYSSSPPNPPTE